MLTAGVNSNCFVFVLSCRAARPPFRRRSSKMLFLFIAFIAPYPGFCLPGDPNNIRFLRLFVNMSVILLSQQNTLMLTKVVHMLTKTRCTRARGEESILLQTLVIVDLFSMTAMK